LGDDDDEQESGEEEQGSDIDEASLCRSAYQTYAQWHGNTRFVIKAPHRGDWERGATGNPGPETMPWPWEWKRPHRHTRRPSSSSR
jgi:hypothetical protein